jgi:hypothetical protein
VEIGESDRPAVCDSKGEEEKMFSIEALDCGDIVEVPVLIDDKEGRVEKGNDGGALDALILLCNIAIRKLCLPLDD